MHSSASNVVLHIRAKRLFCDLSDRFTSPNRQGFVQSCSSQFLDFSELQVSSLFFTLCCVILLFSVIVFQRKFYYVFFLLERRGVGWVKLNTKITGTLFGFKFIFHPHNNNLQNGQTKFHEKFTTFLYLIALSTVQGKILVVYQAHS